MLFPSVGACLQAIRVRPPPQPIAESLVNKLLPSAKAKETGREMEGGSFFKPVYRWICEWWRLLADDRNAVVLRCDRMTFKPTRGHAALRRGRASMPHAEYFLTLCTERRQQGLDKRVLAECVIREIRAMEADCTWVVRCATIMPDHLHLIAVLGIRLSLGQAVQRLKAKTATALRSASLAWEHGYFDRQLRMHDECLPLFLYIYLNPYRKYLCAGDQSWPWFICHENDWAWLQEYLARDLPPPEWLA